MSIPPQAPAPGTPAGATPAGAPGAQPDPSMEDILASIRRILSEDDASGAAKPAPAAEPDVLALDESMLVAEPPDAVAAPEPPAPPMVAPPAIVPPAIALPASLPPQGAPVAAEPPPVVAAAPAPSEALMAPEAEAAAAGSMSSLLRTLVAEREQPATPAGDMLPVWGGGPTLEDMVRAEIRPLLKQWLDANLPPVVERLVRAEIERVVRRAMT